MVDGGAHERYGVIAISTPSPLARQVHLDERSIAQVVSLAQEHVADLGQELLSAITLGGRVVVHQRKAQRRPGVRQSEVITGSFGNP
jgi:hypothetical protein